MMIILYVVVELMSLIYYCSNMHYVSYYTALTNASTGEKII